MVDQKPLPALPTAPKFPNTTTLSVESKHHRKHLIRHLLSDLNDPVIESRQDKWLSVFEDVLDDLGQCMSSGDWIDGIGNGKALKTTLSKASNKAFPVEGNISKVQCTGRGYPEATREEGGNSKDSIRPEAPKPTKLASLELLCSIVSRPNPPPSMEPTSSHLVLCLTPYAMRNPHQDDGFKLVPADIGCSFSVGIFALHEPKEEGDDEYGTILFGLDRLEGNVVDSPLTLVGGTFTFKGLSSRFQHTSLSKVLKIMIYTQFSLILEQHILFDSGVYLKHSRPRLPFFSSSPVNTPFPPRPNDTESHTQTGIPNLPSWFSNFFPRRSLHYRGAETISAIGTGGSLDLTLPSFPDGSEEPHSSRLLGTLHEGHFSGRWPRLSFIREKRYSILKALHHRESQHGRASTPSQPFTSAFKRIEQWKGLLSTSPGVIFSTPRVISDLSEKEQAHVSMEGQKRRLQGDERAALNSLLGWDRKEHEGRGMSGILGFLRQQEISVLYSLQAPRSDSDGRTAQSSTSSSLSSDAEVEQNSTTIQSSTTNRETSRKSTEFDFSPCDKPHWVTYRYYSTNSREDCMLSDWILDTAMGRKNPCRKKNGCTFTLGQHEIRMMHGGIRIIVKVTDVTKYESEKTEEARDGERKEGLAKLGEEIDVWECCAVCNAKTPRKRMSRGTCLYSYAKYLELLIYSPLICTLTPPLCEHTTPPPPPWKSLPSSRLNIVRHFTTESADVSFALSTVSSYKLRVPRLQIVRGADNTSPFHSMGPTNLSGATNDKRALRKEIRQWWEGVSDHMDRTESALQAEKQHPQKPLPRLPSVDDAYDVFAAEETEPSGVISTPTTPMPSAPPPPTPVSPETPSRETPMSGTDSAISSDSRVSEGPSISPQRPTGNPEELLALLRQNFQHLERSLYSQLAKTPETSLNDVRSVFLSVGQGTKKRLRAWQEKHLGSARSKALGDLLAIEPEWWKSGYYVVPGGTIIVRENDWGSIIAHTLSTLDYRLEMANLTPHSHPQPMQAPIFNSAAFIPSGPSTFFSVAAEYRLFSSSRKNPDPDQESIIWNEPEQYSAIISRKEHGRDSSSLFRDVLGRRVVSNNDAGVCSPRFTTLSANPTVELAETTHATTVQAQVNEPLSDEVTSEPFSETDATELEDKHFLGSADITPTRSHPGSVKSGSTSPATADGNVRRGKTSSGISNGSESSQFTIQKRETKDVEREKISVLPSSPPPPLPPKGPIQTQENTTDQKKSDTALPPLPPSPPSNASGFATSLATGLNNAMRYVFSSEASSRLSSSPSNVRHHDLLRADMNTIDERPHIKYDWKMGKRVKFSCTVYYAKQFDVLRKRCGVHDVFVKSLSRSTNWAAEGGKSKANFWKTYDDRFIIKTLVNAWNVADLQALIELAPSYFRYMDATTSKPTVLTKLMGFYTIETKNLESGTVQVTDLLVMENLFYDQNITNTFDLKGIQGRKVKSRGNTGQTLYDGEWIESQQKSPTLLRPYSKAILREAIKRDAEFLSKSNIMDYSLLLGIDEEKKEIACGLVDTIGSFTFAKTLEYKAKQGIHSGKEVTVMPPAEYQQRFVNAMDGYFVACPDKWSKPLDGDYKIINNTNSLPSIL